MKVEERQGKFLFVAESDEENNAIASIICLLGNTTCTVTDEEKNDHGHGYNNGQPRNFVYVPTLEDLEDADLSE